jgi:hypothetical protein
VNVVVLGMHRSGTSAITRLLGNFGFFIGTEQDLIPANEANEDGYWERNDVVDLNKALFALYDADWTAPQSYDGKRLTPEGLANFNASASAVIDSLRTQQPFVLKDPRLCITINDWLPLLADVVFVVCVRHPIEVAQSLLKRNGLTLPVGLALWEHYNTRIANLVQQRPHVCVSYADLVSDCATVTTRIATSLRNLGCINVPNEISEAHYGHIVQRLRHQHIKRKGHVEQLTTQQARIYRALADDRIRSLRLAELDESTSLGILGLLKRTKDLEKSIEKTRESTNTRIDKRVAMIESQLAQVQKLTVALTKHKEALEAMRR